MKICPGNYQSNFLKENKINTMGCFFMSKSSYDPYEKAKANKYKDHQEVYTDLESGNNYMVNRDENRRLPNPDPTRFSIFKHMPVGDYLIVCVKYPDCTNYEGTKVLVYKDITFNKLATFRTLDPHFSENKAFKSPIARFEPTNTGWEMARTFCLAMMAANETPTIQVS